MRRVALLAVTLLGFGCGKPTPPPAPTPASPPPIAAAPQPSKPVETPPAPPTVPQDPPDDPEPPRPDRFPKNDAFIVAPIEGEPEWLDPSAEKEVAKKGFASFPGGYQFEIRDASGSLTQAGVVVAGMILMDRGIPELMACGEGGKEHESILRLECDIHSLDLALQLSGLNRGPIPTRLNDPKVPQGSRVLVLVQWTGEDGKLVTHRAEDCVIDVNRRAPMRRVGWTYVGAMIPIQDPAGAPGKTYRVLAATSSRSLLSTYRDMSTILDNPLEATELDINNDTAYAANHMVLPAPGTKVRVIVRAPDAAARKEIEKIEQELSK